MAKKMEYYRADALTKSAGDIYQELERLRGVIALKGAEVSYESMFDEDVLKSAGYFTALEDRRKGEPEAALYWGIYNARMCGVLDDQKNMDTAARACWSETIDSFTVASDAGLARAQRSIGVIYKNGWGVTKSKLVAAEWYMKAARKYAGDGMRDSALSCLEAALAAAPDHPGVQRLRAQLLR